MYVVRLALPIVSVLDLSFASRAALVTRQRRQADVTYPSVFDKLEAQAGERERVGLNLTLFLSVLHSSLKKWESD